MFKSLLDGSTYKSKEEWSTGKEVRPPRVTDFEALGIYEDEVRKAIVATIEFPDESIILMDNKGFFSTSWCNSDVCDSNLNGVVAFVWESVFYEINPAMESKQIEGECILNHLTEKQIQEKSEAVYETFCKLVVDYTNDPETLALLIMNDKEPSQLWDDNLMIEKACNLNGIVVMVEHDDEFLHCEVATRVWNNAVTLYNDKGLANSKVIKEMVGTQ